MIFYNLVSVYYYSQFFIYIQYLFYLCSEFLLYFKIKLIYRHFDCTLQGRNQNLLHYLFLLFHSIMESILMLYSVLTKAKALDFNRNQVQNEVVDFEI